MQGSGRYLENGNLKTYHRVAGRHCSRNRFESEEGHLNKGLTGKRFARVEALAMAASAVEICLRKMGKQTG